MMPSLGAILAAPSTGRVTAKLGLVSLCLGQALAESGLCVPRGGEARGKRLGCLGAVGNRGPAKMKGAPAVPKARVASPSWEC